MPSYIQIPDEFRQSHTVAEDVQGLAIGLLSAAVGLTFLTHLGFLTGQTAGLALIISYLSGWSFGVVFFLVNLPFYALAWKRLGPEFTLKSLACVAILSVLVDLMPLGLTFETLNPVLGTVIFGVLTGFGLLGVFRHKASLGGLGVVALLAQDHLGIRAGYVQLAVDVALFAVAFFLFPTGVVLYSLFGAVILNGVIAFNHRRDRYIAE
ncbi:YitT family protein [Histidinibacterium aquaticum]|uniref:YitT family protein n=1 Tax=Histidinibacterium aquaticum TaxID=2613962 RepID=A0A5J5GP45_9RHOB|nr:YitT family protein [Histidinibacterium aquaticum]KAA9009304.1 YitT family protein [Histidinibacterium aquaticum]